MRHRVAKRKLNRDTKHRGALLKNLLRQLFLHGAITTTQAKAKELKRQVDSVVIRSKTNSIASRRELHTRFGKRDVVNTLVDVIAPTFVKRTSGFTTIEAVGMRRGDATPLFKVSLLEQREQLGTFKSPAPKKSVSKKRVAKKKTAATAKPVLKKKINK
ncbi:MAG: 50S ribosomal protein L17 [Candidatus Pacebacteria bacterium RIFCSPLOWO2_01_FULL_47_12]|nr:MAG: 50S ribosomal protein L17 [Candidatus Pacebacteria bacterium RIFCSPLOWO2_01_FULL_47_12]